MQAARGQGLRGTCIAGMISGTMSLISLILILVAVGVVMWLINSYLPLDPRMQKILNAVVIIVVVLWLLQVFGVLDDVSAVRVPKVR